jgi:hypothetical protein
MAALDYQDPFSEPPLGRSRQQPRVSGAVTPLQPMASPMPQRTAVPRSVPGFAPGAPAPGSYPNAGGTAAPAAPTPQAPPRTERVTSLMEGEQFKLDDPNHIAKSPKYQFLSMAPYYGRGEEHQLLSDLQSKYSEYWQGWNWDGKGNFRYGGDPAKLHSAWGGYTDVDAYGGYSGGGPLRARWGMDDGGSAATSDQTLNALLSAFSAPPMQAPAPDLSSMLALFQAMQTPQAAAPAPINLTLPEPQAQAPVISQDYATPLQYGETGGLSQAIQLLAQRAPQALMPKSQMTGDALVDYLRRMIGVS